MKRLIIADLKSNNNHGICSGHYYAVARNYLDVFSDCCEVKVAGGPIYLRAFSRDKMIILPYDVSAEDNPIKNAWKLIRNGLALFRQVGKDDVVVVQSSNPTMILFALLMTYYGNSNVYQIHYVEEPMTRLYFRWMMKFVRKRIKGVLCPNDNVGKAYGIPYIVVPDYFFVEKNEKKFNVPYLQKKYDFGIVGRVADDKGIAEATSAIAGKNCTLIVAGQPQSTKEADSIRESAKSCNNIEINLSYITDDDFVNYINSSRYCILNYQGCYAGRSSGVVLDTLFNGVPVIGRKCRALQFIEDNNLGVLYDDIKDFDFESVLDEIRYESFLKSISCFKEKLKKDNSKVKRFLHLL